MHDDIQLFLFDVDGVLTDGRIIYDSNGVETKAFDVADGSGIRWLQTSGVQVGFLTGRSSEVVAQRARDLGVEIVYQGAKNKRVVLDEIVAATGVEPQAMAYMGDDLIDLPVLARVALTFAPADARPEVREAVQIVTQAAGGRGAAREAIEFLLKARGEWEKVLARYQESP